ncbi:PAS domain-containing sensor histidine kinase [Cytobacillus gottheilii]|uniref:PAS domain-containing sensor histidine kinase n=1 Tax=Cytobacillus gottheilii TaxID=859144 RepID=UPI0009BC1D05|nr:PAS domain-containing sensor histidine kinase [Cytobacillus gottheilii]
MNTSYKDKSIHAFSEILAEKEKLFDTFYKKTSDPILFWQEGMIISANPAMCKFIGCSHTDLQKCKIDDFFYKDSAYYATFHELYNSGAAEGEVVFSYPDGESIPVFITLKLNVIANGHLAIFHPADSHLYRERELAESENKFRNLFEGSREGLVLWNERFEIVEMNPSAVQMLDADEETIIGSPIMDLCNVCQLERQQLKDRVGRTSGTFKLTQKNGIEKTFEFSTLHNVFSKLNVTALKDISERLILEEQLRKSETLHVLGELAAGVAHEVRNPLTALKGFIQLLEGSVQEDFSMYFNVISTELERIDSIINEFLFLSKPQALCFSEEDVSNIMKQTLDLLSAQAVLHNIQFITQFSENLTKITCVPNQLKKVFINMIKNAIEVMPNGGFIKIHIERIEEHIKISIIDQGAGMDKEKLKKLGEPFYTTKERGTGLGLMVTYKIVEEHSGRIEVESEVGKGTSFNVYLPVSQIS